MEFLRGYQTCLNLLHGIVYIMKNKIWFWIHLTFGLVNGCHRIDTYYSKQVFPPVLTGGISWKIEILKVTLSLRDYFKYYSRFSQCNGRSQFFLWSPIITHLFRPWRTAPILLNMVQNFNFMFPCIFIILARSKYLVIISLSFMFPCPFK